MLFDSGLNTIINHIILYYTKRKNCFILYLTNTTYINMNNSYLLYNERLQCFNF